MAELKSTPDTQMAHFPLSQSRHKALAKASKWYKPGNKTKMCCFFLHCCLQGFK